jgi:hypothetical protein
VSQVLNSIILDYNYQKRINPQNFPVFFKCCLCEFDILFVKGNESCSFFNCCLGCLPFFEHIRDLLKDMSGEVFFDHNNPNTINIDYYIKSFTLGFLIRFVGYESIVKNLIKNYKPYWSLIVQDIQLKGKSLSSLSRLANIYNH